MTKHQRPSRHTRQPGRVKYDPKPISISFRLSEIQYEAIDVHRFPGEVNEVFFNRMWERLAAAIERGDAPARCKLPHRPRLEPFRARLSPISKQLFITHNKGTKQRTCDYLVDWASQLPVEPGLQSKDEVLDLLLAWRQEVDASVYPDQRLVTEDVLNRLSERCSIRQAMDWLSCLLAQDKIKALDADRRSGICRISISDRKAAFLAIHDP